MCRLGQPLSPAGSHGTPSNARRAVVASCIGVAVALLVAAAPAARPPQTPQPPHTPFVTLLMRDWPLLDRNHDGVLTTDEIDRTVRDPAVHGDDAALAAALKLLSESHKLAAPLPPLTPAYFADYDRAALSLRRRRSINPASTRPVAAESATVDTVGGDATTRPVARSARLPVDWDLYYAASRLRIARGGRGEPFPNRFVLDHTRQGPLGDCYFVAAVGDVINRDPSAIARLVEPAGTGRYRVTFPGRPPVVVGPLTDAELAISSTTAGDGVWLALLEQALGRSRAQAKTGSDDVEGVDLIRDGGSITASIRLLTGHPAGRYLLARTLEQRRATADKRLPVLRRALASALADGRMVLAGVQPSDPPTSQQAATRPALLVGTLPAIPPNVNTKHAYAVLAYDAKADAVTFWNPHGQSFKPRAAAGLTTGYPTDHGRFTVPLPEAYLFVTSFAVERPSPSTTRPTAPAASG